MLKAEDFFDLSSFRHAQLVDPDVWVWEILVNLEGYLLTWFEQHGASIGRSEIAPTANLKGDIFIGEGTVIEDDVSITGPAIIGRNCEIRHGAYIRGNAILGDNAVLGHASELKHSVMMNDARAPHFAYVGDSILGHRVNLGAGTKLSNLSVVSAKDLNGKRPTIEIEIENQSVDTGLTKLGAIIGDDSQTGCNAVTNPGTLIGKNTLVYANTSLAKGYYPDNRIIKLRQQIETVLRR